MRLTGSSKTLAAAVGCAFALAAAATCIDASYWAGTSVGKTPPNDLGARTYQGRQEGPLEAGTPACP
ncbi:MAG TPA: hypothetical protein VGV60_10630 [Candidatus Polarisedimenticolia bacterium]|jgi:hypothetical protein|nr:hypothetical protein [Candidatus Polarisedimenticolia bacterium]